MSEIQLRSDMRVELTQHMGSDLSILAAMMVSTMGSDSVNKLQTDPEEARGKIEYLMRNRHGTPYECNSMTFLVEAPIFVFREWHRHRVGWSYNEMSARYKKLEPVFYVPSPTRKLVQHGKSGHYNFTEGNAAQFVSLNLDLKDSYLQSYLVYESLISRGIAKEIARACLPVGIYSSMWTTCNARSLMHFLSLRTKDELSTYPSFPMEEIEMCARRMENIFAELFPITHSAFCKFGRVAP